MNSFVCVALFACLALANASAAPSTRIIQGPSSRTTILGPDGSAIHSENPGSTIVQEDAPGLIGFPAGRAVYRYPLPLVYSPYPAPLTYGYPLGYQYAYQRPIAYSDGIVAEKQLDTLISGPSGTIATSKTVEKPALVAAPQILAV